MSPTARATGGPSMMGWNEAESAAINAMLPRVESALFGVTMRRGRGETVSDQEEAILVCRAALTALLEATQSETCATCGGTGHWTATRSEVAAGAPPPPAPFNVCAPCNGSGRVPGAPLVLLAPRQVGWVCPWKDGFVTYHAGDEPPSEKYAPLYAAQTEEKQT